MPEYVPGEKLHVAVEGLVPSAKPGEDPTPGELTITVDTPDGPYDVTVPLGCVTVERLIPADGEPRPNEVWRDCSGTDRFAYRDSRSGEICLIGPDGIRNQWSHFNIMYGPLTRVHPPVSVAPAAQPPAETPEEPRLMLGDHYRDSDGDVWTVAEEHGQIGLRFGDEWGAWARVNERYGPLALVQRAGYRPTTKTVSAAQLRSGMVVSHPGWDGDAPVRLLTVQALAAGGVEVTYSPLGDDAEAGTHTGMAAPDARITLWDEIAGGAS